MMAQIFGFVIFLGVVLGCAYYLWKKKHTKEQQAAQLARVKADTAEVVDKVKAVLKKD